jgi:hypothetical protein
MLTAMKFNLYNYLAGQDEKAPQQHQLCKGITTVCNCLSLTNHLLRVTMKNPCIELCNSRWEKDGKEFTLDLGNTFWLLYGFQDTRPTPLTKNCPKPTTITNWLEKNGYKRK